MVQSKPTKDAEISATVRSASTCKRVGNKRACPELAEHQAISGPCWMNIRAGVIISLSFCKCVPNFALHLSGCLPDNFTLSPCTYIVTYFLVGRDLIAVLSASPSLVYAQAFEPQAHVLYHWLAESTRILVREAHSTVSNFGVSTAKM